MKEYLIQTEKNINLKDSLFSGQSFRWEPVFKGSSLYMTMIDNSIVVTNQISSNLISVHSSSQILHGDSPDIFFYRYLSLDIDERKCFPDNFEQLYPDIFRYLPDYMGVRVLRQDAFETLITFMCAQAIGMNIIRRQIRNICRKFGNEHDAVIKGTRIRLYSFPSPETLAAATPHDLGLCTNNNCQRASNIVSAAQRIAEDKLSLEALKNENLHLDTLRDQLSALRGIGPKIADCIMLFGLHRHDAFPVDTHVRQFLGKWFGIETTQQSLTRKTYLELQKRASEVLGKKLAGYAGHILFHCWRNEVRHMKTF